MDGATDVDAWLFFPGTKVGDKIDLYSSFLAIFLVGLIRNPYVVTEFVSS
jgi:hypothetical protein